MAANGTSAALTGSNSSKSDIILALEIVHNPRSDAGTRQKASDFLESQKSSTQAIQCGHELASDRSQAAEVRHFGLSLLEHSVRHNWHSFNDRESVQIREFILALCQAIADNDPPFLRNKVAHLLVELAKKDWMRSWFDLDTTLLQLWTQGTRYQELVLVVLESLSEDVFVREDAAAAVRGQDLNNAVVDIFTPASAFPVSNKRRSSVRADDDGWLGRISQSLRTWNLSSNNRGEKACVQKALATMRSAFTWIMAPAIINTHCLETILSCFRSTDPDVLLSAIEAIHSLYGRSHLDESEFTVLVVPLFHEQQLTQLRQLFAWCAVDCHDIDTLKYTFSKKFSETMAFIAGHIEERPAAQVTSLDLSGIFHFMIEVTRHRSLTVSIPVMHSWSRLLKSQQTGQLDSLWSVIGLLLDTATERIIRYEMFPDDSDFPSILFLNEDIDTIPERHAFLGNYRRFSAQIVELVAQSKPREALTHLSSVLLGSIDDISKQSESFDPANYQKSSAPLLLLDANFTVLEAAFKGYSKWAVSHEEHEDRKTLASDIENLTCELLEKRRFEDPLMKQRVIKLAVETSARALEKNQPFALKVLEHILLTQTTDQPQYPVYSEAVRELQVYATSELRRLSLRHADYFATFYDQLEVKIRDVLTTSKFDEKAESEMYGTLLIVLQRATNLDPTVRDARLQDLVSSVLRGWESSDLAKSLSTFEEFSQRLAIDRVGPYLQSRNADSIEDWSSIQLDDSGLAIQSTITDFMSLLPLRMTKTALGVMTDRLEKNSSAHDIAVQVWGPQIPLLLSKVLQLVQYAHRLHDLSNWPKVAPEKKHIITRILQDRFWQAGISAGSRNEFYSRVTNTKGTLEGFASFVRGKIRLIREAGYQIIHSMSRLGEQFYGYPELPGPLSEALVANTANLSSHQFSVLLQMLRSMVDDCPEQHREHFLPPLLSSCLLQTDKKVTHEWETLGQRKVENATDDVLTAEMKEESILRQLTFTAVTFVAVILDPQRDNSSVTHTQSRSQSGRASKNQEKPPASTANYLRVFILRTPAILEPLLLFATHILTIPDSRSVSTTTRVLRTIVPTFALLSPYGPDCDTPTTTAIREYLSSAVLRAAITALHDGYFVDQQKDLAALIATIWVAYGCVTHFPAVFESLQPAEGDEQDGVIHKVLMEPARDQPPLSDTPRSVMLSLPGMTPQRIEAVEAALTATGGVVGSVRQQRALVLELLDGVRGVRVGELGKIPVKGERSRLQERYMRTETGVRGGDGPGDGDRVGQGTMEGVEGRIDVDVGDGPELTGIGELLR